MPFGGKWQAKVRPGAAWTTTLAWDAALATVSRLAPRTAQQHTFSCLPTASLAVCSGMDAEGAVQRAAGPGTVANWGPVCSGASAFDRGREESCKLLATLQFGKPSGRVHPGTRWTALCWRGMGGWLRAQVEVDLGKFDSAEEAARAYDRAAVWCLGLTAPTNEPVAEALRVRARHHLSQLCTFKIRACDSPTVWRAPGLIVATNEPVAETLRVRARHHLSQLCTSDGVC